MAKFTRTYNVQPNELQRSTMFRCYKALAEYHLSKGDDVLIVTETGASLFNNDNEAIVVQMFINGVLSSLDTRYIGSKGGIKIL